jgi:hypothetical protein
MTTITVNTPAKVTAPRGAVWAGKLFAVALGALERLSASVAERQMHRVVSSREAEAARVRRYAQEVMAQDPRFAADLFAAADRHERG